MTDLVSWKIGLERREHAAGPQPVVTAQQSFHNGIYGALVIVVVRVPE